MIEKRTINIGDQEIAFLERPAVSAAATVLFIHGFPFSSEIWRRQLEALPENVRGIAYDIRGFGKSKAPHYFFSVDLLARDLLSLINGLTLKKVVACGVSMGGYIALRATEISPEKISGLVLCDTNAVADSNDAKLKRFASIEQVLKNGQHSFAEGFVKNLFSPDTYENNVEAVQFIKHIIHDTSVDTICATLLALASRTDTTGMLRSIKCPTVIIRGEDDKLMPQEQALQLKEGIQKAELRLIPHAGHLPNLEQPSEFNLAMNAYLNKHFPS